MRELINYGRQDINEEDVKAVTDVLNSDFLTQGPLVPRFEETMASRSDAAYGVAVNSATSALHIACLSLGVGRGDIVWTSAITFVASANCALYCGADVDFVDIDPDTYNISIECLEKKLAVAEKEGRLPKVIIPVHMCGQSCEMAKIKSLGGKYGFSIIEDASHAVGGQYLDMQVGNCHFSDITVFSFHPVKIITSGEGGMALTNSDELARLMRQFRSHGITSDISEMESRPDDEIWNYQQTRLGFNYRMTDIQAALGLSQEKRLHEFVQIRRKIARRYDEELDASPLLLPFQHADANSSYHLYPVRVKLETCGISQKEASTRLHEAGIIVNLHYIPVYRHPYYEKRGFSQGYCPEAECYFREALSIPIYPGLTKEQQTRVIKELLSVTI